MGRCRRAQAHLESTLYRFLEALLVTDLVDELVAAEDDVFAGAQMDSHDLACSRSSSAPRVSTRRLLQKIEGGSRPYVSHKRSTSFLKLPPVNSAMLPMMGYRGGVGMGTVSAMAAAAWGRDEALSLSLSLSLWMLRVAWAYLKVMAMLSKGRSGEAGLGFGC